MRNGLIGPLANPPPTLADVLTGLERNKRLSARRRRRRRSVVFRVARLLGDEPGAIVLDSIGARLATINPIAGATASLFMPVKMGTATALPAIGSVCKWDKSVFKFSERT